MENPFLFMQDRIRSSMHFAALKQMLRPLQEHFSVNYFWYYKITSIGNYTFIGTHQKWVDHIFESQNLLAFPFIKNPRNYASGICMMNKGNTGEYNKILNNAAENFSIYFQFQIIEKNENAVSACGFAAEHDSPKITNRLLNELSLLQSFIGYFREKNANLLEFADMHSVNLLEYFDISFDANNNDIFTNNSRDKLVNLLFPSIAQAGLTKREKEILPYITGGYPASYIAHKLYLSRRTIENHIANIKHKLACETKSELMKTASQFNKIYNNKF